MLFYHCDMSSGERFGGGGGGGGAEQNHIRLVLGVGCL